jgi:nuclear pore complex protein Nup133
VGECRPLLAGSSSDGAYVRALSATPVARAARRCYDAAFAVCLGPPFEEVLSPR